MIKLRFAILFFIISGSIATQLFPIERPVKRNEAVVKEVIDGDTVKVGTVNGEVSVRLLYIDAMEKSDNTKMKSDIRKLEKNGIKIRKKDLIALGKIAKIYLHSILRENDRVILEMVKGNEKDHYGRTLAVIYKNNTNINLLMVQNGYARAYFVGNVNDQIRKTYLIAEEKARSENLVIWNYLKK